MLIEIIGPSYYPNVTKHQQPGVHTSESTNDGVRVHVTSRYSPDRSEPFKNVWLFLYTIEISNEGTEPVQLISRHWIIKDAESNIEEVKGLGVVGQQPTLAPGDTFEYTSSCPLSTPFGTMEGSYQMVNSSGKRFDVKIATFTLSEPYTIH